MFILINALINETNCTNALTKLGFDIGCNNLIKDIINTCKPLNNNHNHNNISTINLIQNDVINIYKNEYKLKENNRNIRFNHNYIMQCIFAISRINIQCPNMIKVDNIKGLLLLVYHL